MRVVIFCHSILSDWNHGNAHFLRGIITELRLRGHDVTVYEPRDSWSLSNLISEHGYSPVRQLFSVYPWISSVRYDVDALDLDCALGGADIVIVHEWNDPGLVKRIGDVRARTRSFRLFFHDTHHRSVTKPEEMSRYDLSDYDGVLAFGEVIRDIYLSNSMAQRAWTWHEAADTRVFYPAENPKSEDDDLVWIGNWGDEERTGELMEFVLEPARNLGLKATFHGVRYPDHEIKAIKECGVEYAGWVPNYAVPRTYASYRFTVHVPRRPYARSLPGIPTIRVFEALACGIPLITSPWDDAEGLFSQGTDFLVARSGKEMEKRMKELVNEPQMREEFRKRGRSTILKKHTCAHRANELLGFYKELEGQQTGVYA